MLNSVRQSLALEQIVEIRTLLEVKLFRLLSLFSRVGKDELHIWSSRSVFDNRHI